MTVVLAQIKGAVGPSALSIQAAQQLPASGGLQRPPLGAVYGVVLNSKMQLAQMGEALSAAPYQKPPAAPILYIKPPNTYAGDDAVVALPEGVERLEVNATLAVVIGAAACRVSERDAMAHVLGYTVAIDVCIPHQSFYRPAVRERCRDGFLPIGPWITPREAVGDPATLAVATSINGAVAGAYAFSDLARPVERLIADVTDFMTLARGDVLLVGLAPDAPQAGAGDRVTAGILGVGELHCRIAEATA